MIEGRAGASFAPELRSAASRAAREACYVCGRPRLTVRFSHHWRHAVCAACLEATRAEPVGFLCEARLASGRLCREPATRRRVCREHLHEATVPALDPELYHDSLLRPALG